MRRVICGAGSVRWHGIAVQVWARATLSSSNSAEGDDAQRAVPRAVKVGYGPFSAAARARVARECGGGRDAARTATTGQGDLPSPTTRVAVPNVMRDVQLTGNVNLRLSLGSLPHPSQLQTWQYRSEPWRLAMTRLYRTIIRLHNKTIAVSLDTARRHGAAEAIAAVAHPLRQVVRRRGAIGEDGRETPDASDEEQEQYMQRYLLTEEQRAFGNHFVKAEFTKHLDADARAATTFYAGWYQYVLQLSSGVTAREMSEAERRLLSEEQQEQLRQLHKACIDLHEVPPPLV